MGSQLIDMGETVQGYSELIGVKRMPSSAVKVFMHMCHVCEDPARKGRPPANPLAYDTDRERRRAYYQKTTDGDKAQYYNESRARLKDRLNITERQASTAVCCLLRLGFITPEKRPHNGQSATYWLRVAEMYTAICAARDAEASLNDALAGGD